MATTTVTAESIRAALLAALGDAPSTVGDAPSTVVDVEDVSGGCGASFVVSVVSESLAGKTRLARHRTIQAALAELMPAIHALSISKAATPGEEAAKVKATTAGG
jgi:stress-induced morphogen